MINELSIAVYEMLTDPVMQYGSYNEKINIKTMSNIKLFEDKQVRTFWDEKEEQWYFSIVDVVEVLTNSANPRDYWFKMKIRVKIEDGLELSTICRQFKLKATDGKMRQTDCSGTQNLLRIIQSIPSPKASVVTGENFLPPKKENKKLK